MNSIESINSINSIDSVVTFLYYVRVNNDNFIESNILITVAIIQMSIYFEPQIFISDEYFYF